MEGPMGELTDEDDGKDGTLGQISKKSTRVFPELKNGDVIRLRSWKGDYLSSLGTEPGVTPGDAGEGSEWIVEKYKYAAPGREIVFLKSSKGDYLYRLETSKGVSTGKLEKGYLWLIVADGDKVKLRSYKQDYLHRGPEGITTWGTGKGNLWVIELVQTEGRPGSLTTGCEAFTAGPKKSSKTLPVIPPNQRVYKPSFSLQSSENEMKYNFVGRIIYISDIYQILKQENYPFEGDIDSSVKKEIFIKADTFYCDKMGNNNDYDIPGISTFSITVRSTVGEGCNLALSHDLAMKKSYEKAKAAPGMTGEFGSETGKPGENGIDGTDGLQGTKVIIAQMEGSGVVNIFVDGADGTKGQNGGDGGKGGKGASGLDEFFECGEMKGYDKKCKTKKTDGEAGKNGGTGGNAGKEGQAGNGGNSGSLSLYVPKIDEIGITYVVQGCPGKGAKPSSPGKPGEGGEGGKGGNGMRCKVISKVSPYRGNLVFCVQGATIRAPDGKEGARGQPSSTTPKPAKNGIFQESKVDALNTASFYDKEILELIVRTGEDAYLKGKKTEAKDIFNSVLDATEGSNQEMVDYLNLMIKRIDLGLNFFGYRETYVPERSWKTIGNELTFVLKIAEDESKEVNSVLQRIETISVLSAGFKQVKKLNIVPFEQELSETEKLIQLQQYLKKKTISDIKEIESIMKKCERAFKIQLRKALTEQKRRQAIAIGKFLMIVVGWGISFKQKDPAAILGAFGEVNNFVDEAGLYPSDKCYRPLKDLLEIGKSGMKFSMKVPNKDEDIDLTKLDAQSTIHLLQAMNKDNSGTIVLEFNCLIRMAGYQGTKLQVAIETYFDYGASRLDMFSNLIDIDLNLKKLQYQKKRQLATIEELRKSKDKAEETISGGTAMVQRLQLKSNLIQAFRSFESDALENFFLQAAAYRFATLWDFDIFSSYSSLLGDTQSTANTNIFNGYAPLKNLKMRLENMKCVYKKCIQQRFNTPKEPKAWLWEFGPRRNPKMFENLKNFGVAQFTIDKRRICGDDLTACLNLRLKKVYVEVKFEALDKAVKKIYVHLTHLGDNTFYFPNSKHIQLKNEKASRTVIDMVVAKMTNENCAKSSTCESVLKHDDDRWQSMCTANPLIADDEMFGDEPCRSPFATYMLRIPIRKRGDKSSLTKNGRNLKANSVVGRNESDWSIFSGWFTGNQCAGFA